MTIAEQLKDQPRNAWTRFRIVLDLIEKGDTDLAERVLDQLSYHPRIDAETLDIYAGHLRRAQRTVRVPRKVNTPSDYLGYPDGRLNPPFRCLEAGRDLPGGFPPHLCLPDWPGARNDHAFIDDATATLHPGGIDAHTRLHVIYAPARPDETDLVLDRLAQQDVPGDITVTVFGGPNATAGTHGFRSNGTCHVRAAHILGTEAQAEIRRIAEACDFVLFLNGFVALDDLALRRMAWRAALTDNLVQPLVRFSGTGGMATGFSDEVNASTFNSRFPFREMTGLNMGVPAGLLRRVGPPDTRFEDSYHAARELAFRMYNAGAYFAPQPARHLAGISHAKAYPADAELYRSLCPNNWDRRKDGSFEVPKVSVYIPAYNASRYIERAIDSVLAQDVRDLDVCIANDGSSDDTLARLEARYDGEPRVRWSDNPNGGIGFASNQAVRMSNSLYVGQLDSDDALKPGAVRTLMEYLDTHPDTVCCYSSAERIDPDGNHVQNEYSWPVFSREKMMITSITHHFRMFRRAAWERTGGFREDIVNAVDYDMFLKLSEIGAFHHVDEVYYQRRWHGRNTSSVNEHHQTANTYRAQREALRRLGLDTLWDVHAPDPEAPRKITYRLREGTDMVLFWPDYSYSNPYQKRLYARMRRHTEVVAGDIDAALEVLQRADGPAVTFHLHWLNFLFTDVTDSATATQVAEHFAERLESFVAGGGRLVWTVHNTVSHDTAFPELEADLSARIARLAHVVHLHSEASRPEVESHFPLPHDKLRISPHGNYIGSYPNYVSRPAARRALDIDPGADVLLFAGQVRPYKGVKQLVSAFRDLLARRPNTLLVLAGQQSFDPLLAVDTPLREDELARIRVANRFLDNAELQLFFNAADAAVCPYRNILTSGSMMLALSFGTPVVIPSVGHTREVLAGRDAGVLYDPDNGEKALTEAIETLLSRKDAGESRAMHRAALALAQDYDWPDFSPALEA
ncbi:glycosyltransferase [Roseovarius sp.]|uniref:glycosyltransferase n=1 Tax=Roseovarius sp. TaxID=1486281 RepID=UPI003BA887F8